MTAAAREARPFVIADRTSLRERMQAGERLLGALVRLPAEQLVENAGLAGLDYLVIDCEHGAGDVLVLQQHLVLASSVGLDVLVRVPLQDPALLLRALDAGATGIVVPHVESTADARAAVAAAHYPPRGERGFATYTRAGRLGLLGPAEHLQRAAAQTLVVVMIETVNGVRAAADILGTDGVDAVLVGPADLSMSMGLAGRVDEPAVQAALGDVHVAARATGCRVMQLAGSPQRARAAHAEGADLVVYNVALVLTQTFAGLAAARPEQPPDPVER